MSPVGDQRPASVPGKEPGGSQADEPISQAGCSNRYDVAACAAGRLVVSSEQSAPPLHSIPDQNLAYSLRFMPRLLYLSPVMPAPRGNGLAMRAYMVLSLLANRHDVSLAVAPLYGAPQANVPSAVSNICRDVVF